MDFERDGEYVPFGNSNAESDELAVELTEDFFSIVKKHKMYKNAIPCYVIADNYIKCSLRKNNEGAMLPCGSRRRWNRFRQVAKPDENGRDVNGSVASLIP